LLRWTEEGDKSQCYARQDEARMICDSIDLHGFSDGPQRMTRVPWTPKHGGVITQAKLPHPL